MSSIEKIAHTVMKDSLQNLTTGMNTAKAKKYNTEVGSSINLQEPQLTSLYADNWIVGKIVDLIADDSTRNWFKLTGLSVDDIEILKKAAKNLKVQSKINEAMKMARLYGDCLAVIVTKKDRGFETPLKMENITKENPIVAIQLLDKTQLSIDRPDDVETDITSEYFGQPKYFQLRNTGFFKKNKCHISRVLRFSGQKESYQKRITSNGWNSSVVNRIFDPIVDFETVKNSVVELMDELNLDIVKVKNLDGISNDKKQMEALLERFREFSNLKSVYKVAIIGENEDYERLELKMSSIEKLIQSFAVILAAAGDIPFTRFFSTSAQGLNATGRGDEDNYDESIASIQEFELKPNLEKLYDGLVRSFLDSPEEKLNYEIKFNKLSNPTDEEISKTQKNEAETDKTYIENGVITNEEARAKLITEGRYNIEGTLPQDSGGNGNE